MGADIEGVKLSVIASSLRATEILSSESVELVAVVDLELTRAHVSQLARSRSP